MRCPKVLAVFALLAFIPLRVLAQDIPVVSIAATSNFDKRFEVFAIGADGILYHRWQQTGVDQWSDWATNAAGKFSEAKALRLDARLFLFGLDAGILTIRSQHAAGSAWDDVSFRTGHDLQHIAVTTNATGKIEVVAIGGNGALWTIRAKNNAPQLQAEDWSEWETIGGSHLIGVSAGRDGDGRVTVAALDNAGHIYVAQESQAGQDGGWSEWPLLPASNVSDIELISAKDLTLWLLATGENGWLYARSLSRVGTGPLLTPEQRIQQSVAPTEKETGIGSAESTVPPKQLSPQQKAAHTVTPSGKQTVGAAESTILPPPLAMGQWTDWSTISQEPFVFLTKLAVATNKDGLGEVAGVAGPLLLHIGQRPDGLWPDSWSVVPLDNKISDLTTVALVTNADGQSRIFISDHTNGKVFTIAKAATDRWDSQSWTSLGKIPGSDEPDVVFAAVSCIERLVNDGSLTPAELTKKVTDLRAAIAAGIPARVSRAVAGTPLASLLGNVNSSSRCTSHGEVIALWLNHEVWPGFYEQDPHIPVGSGFVYRIPAATLTNVITGQVVEAIKTIDGIETTGYSVSLNRPNEIAINLQAKYLKMPFDAKATATFSAQDLLPTCTANLTASRPDGLYAIFSVFFLPGPAISSVTTWGDMEEAAVVAKAGSKINLICRLTDAILTNLFIPRKNPPTACATIFSVQNVEKLKMLVIPYDHITIDKDQGLVGWGDFPHIPSLVDPQPGVSFAAFPVSPAAWVNSLEINVGFIAQTKDLNPPLTLTWTPSYSRSLRLDNHPGLKGDLSDLAFFVFAVAPDPNPHVYDLGEMHLAIEDSEHQCVDVTQSLVMATRKID